MIVLMLVMWICANLFMMRHVIPAHYLVSLHEVVGVLDELSVRISFSKMKNRTIRKISCADEFFIAGKNDTLLYN